MVGQGAPASKSWVLALKALQNSIIFSPFWPNAGPTGGDGLAFPAGICNFIYPLISFSNTLHSKDALRVKIARPCLSSFSMLKTKPAVKYFKRLKRRSPKVPVIYLPL